MNKEHRVWLLSKREEDGLPWKTASQARTEGAPQDEARARERGGKSRRRWV